MKEATVFQPRVLQLGVHHLIFRGAWKLGLGKFIYLFIFFFANKGGKVFFFFNSSDGWRFFFLVSQVGNFCLFKDYHFATEFGGLKVFSSLPLAAKVFFSPLRLVNFFKPQQQVKVFFFFQKTSMLPPPRYQMVRPLKNSDNINRLPLIPQQKRWF